MHTRKNITGVKLGSIIFQKLFSEVHKYFPDKDLIATRVRKKNVDAQRFYKRMGGNFFDLVSRKFLAPSEIDTTVKGQIGVFYDKDDLLELSQREIPRPKLEDISTKKKTKSLKKVVDKEEGCGII